MTDIVKRLRSFDVFNAPMDIEGVMVSPVALMAADEIERLRAERDRMKKALEEIEDPPSMVFDFDDGCGVCAWMSNRAEDALKGDDQ